MSGTPDRPASGLLAFVQRLRKLGGKRFADALVTAAVAIAATASALALNITTPFRFLENFTYDLRQQLGAPPPPNDFAIIKIDDAALTAMAESTPCRCTAPMNKVWLGEMIAALDQKGAKAILVDYLLDVYSSEEEAAQFQALMANVKTPVIVGADPSLKPGVDYPVIRGLHYADPSALLTSDYDDIMRRYEPKPSQMYSLSAELARRIGVTPPTAAFDVRYRKPMKDTARENAGAIAPSFPGAIAAFLPEPFIKDKIVLIGRVTRSAEGEVVLEDDTHTTPLRFLPGHEKGTPGVEVHAHALAQMIQGDMIRKPGPVELAAIVLVAALLGAALGRSTQRWWISIGVVIIGIAVSAAGAVALYQYAAFMAPMTAPALAFTFAFFTLSRLIAAELSSQRAFYSSTLERYLAPQVIDRMVSGGDAVTISAEEREITVMISDLENFSNLVASLDLETFTGVINEYLGGMLDILWKHEAMIDKMTGDGIIAFFGAPVQFPDHADRAIACAREMDTYGLEIRARMHERGLPFGFTRMGISSGVAMVGNFGGERRFNYTAYGETVVIAARLEAANKTFNTRILFSGDTLKLAQNRDVPIQPVGEIDLKGVPVPIPAYTVVTG